MRCAPCKNSETVYEFGEVKQLGCRGIGQMTDLPGSPGWLVARSARCCRTSPTAAVLKLRVSSPLPPKERGSQAHAGRVPTNGNSRREVALDGVTCIHTKESRTCLVVAVDLISLLGARC